MRAVGVVRVTPEDVGRRVSLRRRTAAAPGSRAGAPRTTDAVGTLLAHDGTHLLIGRRDGGRVRVRAADLVAARVVPPRPAAALALDAGRPATPPRADLQLCLNGARTRWEHPALPLDERDLTAEARAAAALGVRLLHVHARDAAGAESLAPPAVENTVRALRAGAPGCEVSVSTAAWIEGDPARRAALVERWEELPDVASVNVAEDGAIELAGLLDRIGVGVEAGLASVADVQLLRSRDLAARCLRILLEPGGDDPDVATRLAAELHARVPSDVAQLVHGEDRAAWAVLRWGYERGLAVRIGLEDTLTLPDGRPAKSNAALAAAALEILGR